MDKIFKERFRNFEKKAPDYMLEQILDKVEGTTTVAPKSTSFLKVALWSAAAVTALLVTVLLLPNKTSEVSSEISKKEILVSQKINQQNNPVKIQNTEIETEDQINIKTKQNTSDKRIVEVNSSVTVLPQNEPLVVERKEDNKRQVLETQFRIIAPQYTCNGECVLKIDKDYLGTWKADKSVFIQNVNSSKTLVRCSEQEKVLFTFLYDGQKDTFTVFFTKPVKLMYTVTAETCGGENGKVELDLPESRQFLSANELILKNKAFSNLLSKEYTIELKDNFSCNYIFNLNVPNKQLKGEIVYDALETRVNYPIYFSLNSELEDADYIWNFGDGESSYEKAPEHKYEKAGEYTISVEVRKADCSETVKLETLEIKDKALEIPNIFTPNNDGKNDVFMVSVPENLKSFEAVIMNREGQLIYKWSDPKQGWDGLMLNGQKAQSGSYYYIIKGVDANNKSFEYKSFLELRR